MRTTDGAPASDQGGHPSVDTSFSLPRTRVKLCAYGSVAAVSAVSGSPLANTVAIALVCLLVPLAVAILGGGPAVRRLLFIPARRQDV